MFGKFLVDFELNFDFQVLRSRVERFRDFLFRFLDDCFGICSVRYYFFINLDLIFGLLPAPASYPHSHLSFGTSNHTIAQAQRNARSV